jgi:hypothetical protein
VNAGQIIVIALSVLLALWVGGGMWYNRRRARLIWEWLEPGLELLGGEVGRVWIGSSGAGLRVDVEHPSPPLRRLEVIVRLLSRENLPLWLFELLQGRRDQLMLRVWLQSPGRDEIEITPVNGTTDGAMQDEADRPWERTSVSPRWVIARRGKVTEERLEAWRAFVDVYDRQLQRISKRRRDPHLLVQMSFGDLMNEPSGQLFHRLKAALTRP